jgi:hypothetical protein
MSSAKAPGSDKTAGAVGASSAGSPRHNNCCLIQSHYELGIETMFWKDEPVEQLALPAATGDPAEAWAWI